jgi:hypothetical protein
LVEQDVHRFASTILDGSLTEHTLTATRRLRTRPALTTSSDGGDLAPPCALADTEFSEPLP